MNMVKMARAAGVAAGLAMALPALGHDMIHVGVNQAQNKLMSHFDITFPVPIEESSLPGIPGYAGAVMGFEALLFDHADDGAFKLPDNCNIRVRVLGYDTGVFLWNDNSSAQLNVGEAFNVGTPYFHTHPIWQITEPGFGNSYKVILALEDSTGNYQTSDPFTLTFTPVPTPGAVFVLGAAGILAGRRRR